MYLINVLRRSQELAKKAKGGEIKDLHIQFKNIYMQLMDGELAT